MEELEDKLHWVYTARNNKELAERYDQLADIYDYALEEVTSIGV